MQAHNHTAIHFGRAAQLEVGYLTVSVSWIYPPSKLVSTSISPNPMYHQTGRIFKCSIKPNVKCSIKLIYYSHVMAMLSTCCMSSKPHTVPPGCTPGEHAPLASMHAWPAYTSAVPTWAFRFASHSLTSSITSASCAGRQAGGRREGAHHLGILSRQAGRQGAGRGGVHHPG